jgi:short-subunit dehydrogenase
MGAEGGLMNILITGVSGGFGSEIAKQCIAEGHNVIGMSRRKVDIPQMEYVYCDIADMQFLHFVMRTRVVNRFEIDAVINCAGQQSPVGKIWEQNITNVKNSFGVNLFAPIVINNFVLPGMMKKNKGKIINFSGGGASAARNNFNSYAMAKTAIVRYTEDLASELGAYNIQVNALAPGILYSGMTDEVINMGIDAAGKYEYETALSTKQFPPPPDNTLRCISWLLSDESNGCTGRFISAKWDAYKKADYDNLNLYKLRRTVE